MKSFLILTLFTTLSFAFIVGNPHDYTNENFSDNTSKEACANCHTLDLDSINAIDTSFKESSLVCLSCHDGVNARNMPMIYPRNGTVYRSFGSMNLDSSHPVMIDYIEGKAGLRLRSTSINEWSNANNINDLLRDGKVECGSCHNPHQKKLLMYLKHNNDNSELCFSCHDK